MGSTPSTVAKHITQASVRHHNQYFSNLAPESWQIKSGSGSLSVIAHRHCQVLQEGELLRVHAEQQSVDIVRAALPGASVEHC